MTLLCSPKPHSGGIPYIHRKTRTNRRDEHTQIPPQPIGLDFSSASEKEDGGGMKGNTLDEEEELDREENRRMETMMEEEHMAWKKRVRVSSPTTSCSQQSNMAGIGGSCQKIVL